MKKQVVVLPGDGVGEEVTRAAVKVIKHVGKKFNVEIKADQYLIGGACLDRHGISIEDSTIEKCKQADAVFLGAVGGPKWDNNPRELRPEIALLRLRKELGLFTNIRPVKVFNALSHSSSLKPEFVQNVDLMVVRELTGGIYFGSPKFTEKVDNEERAVDTMEYRTSEIQRIARVAFEAARKRLKKVTSVDKANILATSQLWRKTVNEVAADYRDIELEHMLVDNCAMQLIRNPRQFDVILTANMFGDILSDEAAMLTGSLGMLPSASLGKNSGLYEPVHGSAPDIAGKNIANPLAAIGSAALMFRHSFNMEPAARTIENAVEAVLKIGYRTKDLAVNGQNYVGTAEITKKIIEKIDSGEQFLNSNGKNRASKQVSWLLESMSFSRS